MPPPPVYAGLHAAAAAMPIIFRRHAAAYYDITPRHISMLRHDAAIMLMFFFTPFDAAFITFCFRHATPPVDAAVAMPMLLMLSIAASVCHVTPPLRHTPCRLAALIRHAYAALRYDADIITPLPITLMILIA